MNPTTEGNEMSIPTTVAIATFKGHDVERIECTAHAAHAGKVAYKRKGDGALDASAVCRFVRLAYSPLARAASAQRMGPWSADVVEQS